MIRITASKTLKVLEYILDNTLFSQTEIKENTNISIGLVNRIVTWLLNKEFIIKKESKYFLAKPNRLAELIAIQVTTSLEQTYYVDLTKKEALNLIKKNNGVLCLNSALELYSKTELDSEIHMYLSSNQIKKEIEKIPRGKLKINVYSSDLETESKYIQKTDIVRTIIDFYSINKHNSVQNIMFDKWGTMQ